MGIATAACTQDTAMIRTIRRSAILGLISVITGSAASAQTAPALTVLELFTSQGCSSCPAADALFKSYVERPDVLALSFSVDYWDYLGWKDTLASPKFTERQRVYGKSVNNGQILRRKSLLTAAATSSDRQRAISRRRSRLRVAVRACRRSRLTPAAWAEPSRFKSPVTARHRRWQRLLRWVLYGY